jgi:hypothetical protein
MNTLLSRYKQRIEQAAMENARTNFIPMPPGWMKNSSNNSVMGKIDPNDPYSIEQARNANPTANEEAGLEMPMLADPYNYVGMGLGTGAANAMRKFVAPKANQMLTGYHRTTVPFEGDFVNMKNKFGVSFAGDRGFYFSPEINDPTADIFGKHIISANLDIKNPAQVHQVNMGMVGHTTPRSIIPVDKKWLEQNPEAAREGGLVMANSLEDVIAGAHFKRANAFEEYDQQVRNAAKNKQLFRLVNPEKLYNQDISLLEQKGYDGFNYIRPESATSSMPSQTVVFRPEQIKRIQAPQD